MVTGKRKVNKGEVRRFQNTFYLLILRQDTVASCRQLANNQPFASALHQPRP